MEVNQRNWSTENQSAVDEDERLLRKKAQFELESVGSTIGSTTDAHGSTYSEYTLTESEFERKTAALDAQITSVHFQRIELSNKKVSMTNGPQLNDMSNNMPYTAHAEMFPRSGPRKQRVLLATFEQKPVIVKWRSKALGFKDAHEHAQWQRTMRLLRLQSLSNGTKPISSLLALFEDDFGYHVVMEEVPGRDLFDYFQQEKPFERLQEGGLHQVRQLIKGVLLGVKALHDLNLFHRDLKLENVVLDEVVGGRAAMLPKVIDYDTVQNYERENMKTFHIQGTDQYIAPETYNGRSSFSSDLWAVGIMCYILVTGCFPFHPALFDDQAGENYFGHPKMAAIYQRLILARVEYSSCYAIFAEFPIVEDFCRGLLMTDPKKRMDVDAALAHPFMQGL